MIKSIKKISRKHYIQCGLAVLLTGLVLYFTSALWLDKSIIVSFNAEAKKNITYQLFYTETKGQGFNVNQSIRKQIKSGNQRVEIILPIQNIVNLRLDIGSEPGEVKISDLQIEGSESIELNYNEFNQKNIDKFEIEHNKLHIISNHNDPYISYKKDLNLLWKTRVDWCRFIIISILSFLLMYKFVQYLSRFKIEKHHSRIDIVMLAVFFALLFVPMSHISDAEKSKQENRMLAKKPQLTINGRDNNYGVQFDAWYNDHFFGRDAMIYMYNYLKFYISPRGFNNNAMVGKDGWLFLKNSIYVYDNSIMFTEQELDLIGKNIKSFVERAENCGFKQVYFLLSSDKEILYSEYYPDYIKRKGNLSRLKQLLEYMHKNYSEIHFLNFENKFRELKNSETIFYKTGTHMNNIGAYYEYYFLMNEIKRDFPELSIIKLKDFDVTTSDDIRQPGGDLDIYRKFTVIPGYMKENFKNKILTLKRARKNEVKTVKVLEENLIRTFKTRANDSLHYKLSATFISDSFGRRYENYLPYSFSKVSHLYIGAAKPFDLSEMEKEYIINNPSDILIVETVERYLQRFLTLEFPENPRKEN